MLPSVRARNDPDAEDSAGKEKKFASNAKPNSIATSRARIASVEKARAVVMKAENARGIDIKRRNGKRTRLTVVEVHISFLASVWYYSTERNLISNRVDVAC